ncbi:MAG TPA: CHASE3 domain-containing protein [Azospirillaceae bacterium]|nr:CHASE3 domain-containing protein [Azospirillaceae bacterium]
MDASFLSRTSSRAAWLGGISLTLLAAATAVITWVLVAEMDGARNQVDHTYEVMGALHLIEANLADAETGQRGFLLTGEADFLVPYEEALAAAPSHATRLVRLTAGNAAQNARAVELAELTDAKTAELRTTLEAGRAVGTDVAAAEMRARGRLLMSAVRDSARVMAAEERHLLDARHARAEALEQWAFLALGAASALSLAVAAWALRVTSAESLRRADLAAAADAANRAKTDFLAAVSHELRTPLNAVIGFSEMLLSTPLDAEQTRYVLYQRDAGRGLLTLIGDVLDFSKIEAGQLDLEEADFDARDLAEGCRALVAHAAAGKGLVLTVRVDPAVPAALRGDAARVRQVLLNFLSNAVKFTEAGSVTLKVSPASAGGVRFAVSDTGAGVPGDKMEALFLDFSRAARTGTRGEGGTGLGLAISKRLAERMGGSIGVSSVEGAGATFWIDLPLPAGCPDRVARSKSSAEAAGRPLRVLLADDVEPNRVLAARVLERAGHAVVAVADGAEALEAARGGGFDVVVLDVQMPVMDGVEAARHIRALGGAAGAVPILALTAGALRSEAVRCREAGMDAHMAKPFEPAALVAQVRDLTAVVAETEGECGLDHPEPPVAHRDPGRLAKLAEVLGLDEASAFLNATAAGLRERADALETAAGPVEATQAAHILVSLAGNVGLDALSARARVVMQRSGEDGWSNQARALAAHARAGAAALDAEARIGRSADA